MASTKTKGTGGKKRSAGGGKKKAVKKPAARPATTTAAPAPTAPAPARMQAPARPFAAERVQARGSATPTRTKDPLQASIERQNQLQLMIRTQNSARAWAANVRQMQIVILFVWFGFWAFLDSFLSIGHRLSHLLSLPHRSASHDVIIIEGALAEGLISAVVAIGIGLLLYKGVQKAVRT